MILEFRTNGCTWHMIDSDCISFSYFNVGEKINKIEEKNKDQKISELFRDIVKESGFVIQESDKVNIFSDKDLRNIKSIMVVVINRKEHMESFVFDYDYNFRICYNDGTIIREYGKP